MRLRGVAFVIEGILEYGGWEEADMDLIDLIDDDNIKVILLEAIPNGGEMSNKDIDMVEEWVTDKINYQ